MICARCTADTAKSPCAVCGASPYLQGRYRLEERVGASAASSLYRAVEIMGRQRVALREFPVNGSVSDDLAEALDQTFARVVSVQHHGAVEHRAAFAGDNPAEPAWWVVRGWVEGLSVGERIRLGPASESDVLDLLADLLPVLGAYHDAGLCHGNIGPDTVIVARDERVRLVDPSAFSDTLVERGAGGEERVPEWAAPEEARRGPSQGADLYRVGVLAAALLAGREPASLESRSTGVFWDGKSRVAPAMSALIDALTQHDVNQRTASVQTALSAVKAAQTNPASIVGITSSWEEYEPALTPAPTPERTETETERTETERTETVDSQSRVDTVDSVSLSTFEHADSASGPVPSQLAPTAHKRPGRPPGVVGGGPLPIGMPESGPQAQASNTPFVLVGCAALFMMALIAGVVAGMWLAFEPDTQTTTAQVPPVAPSPSVPEPPDPVVPVVAEPGEPSSAEPVVPIAVGLPDVPSNPDMALLRVRCDRRALVALNGRVVDRTPLDIELQPGEYELTATIESLPDWLSRRSVVLRRGEMNVVQLEL